MPSDFDALQEAGVDVRGAVVLTRYGGCFRGLKAMNAEARGAAATLIYSDPAEDGFALGPTFPEGPWRPPQGVQRGSAQFLSLCAGDPFRLYLDGAEDPCGVEFIPKKPVLPLSYADAAPLLARLGGPDAPPAFRGALNLTYTLGPSVGWRVEMTTSNAFEPGAIPNVIAVLNGTDGGYGADTARPVLAGNHRDAWVLGAVDPHSGTVALLETARALFQLKVDDPSWRPRRTIVLCSWTGEEYGLIGSTAFTELHADLLRNAVAYVNVDVAVSGSHHLTAAGTQTLDALFAHAARDVTHAVGGALGEVSLESLWAAADDDEDAKAAMADVSKLGTLGSGSDYTAFIDALGIASIDFSFVGPEGGAYGTYHSVYDSFTYVETVVDPDFKTHVSAAKLFALLVYRLADEAVLDFKLSTQARAVDAYVAELRAGAALNFAPLEAAAIRFAIGAACADAAALNATAETAPKINDHLAFTERRFLADGLPQRPWYKHVLQAPGFYLGYGSTAFPGVAHAFEDGDFESAQTQIGIAAGRIAAAADFLAELC